MKRTEKALKIYLVLTVLISLVFLGVKAPGFYYMFQAKQVIAEGGFPVQTGLVNTKKTYCQLVYCSGVPCGCTGDSLCTFVDMGECAESVEISGASAGGNNPASAIIIGIQDEAASGYTAGAELIAGGASPMFTAVIATPGGCAGCGH